MRQRGEMSTEVAASDMMGLMNDISSPKSSSEGAAEQPAQSMADRSEGRSRRPDSDTFREFMGANADRKSVV